MGCRLHRAETIYFLCEEGSIPAEMEADLCRDKFDPLLLPCVYSEGRDGRLPRLMHPVVPIEIRTFDP